MKTKNGSSHALIIRKSHQGIWGGRQRASAILNGKNRNKKTPKANKNCGKTKGEVF